MKMCEESIKNLGELVQKAVGPTKKVIRSSAKRFTAPGENYMGLVLKIDSVIETEKAEEEFFSAVAKCVNSNVPEVLKESIPNQFVKENGFYTEIVPTLEEFQKEIGLEERGIFGVFPKLYTSRPSLEENAEIPDDNSVLLFEYLGDKGYVNTDRTLGFDLEGAKLVLKDLAAFHAVPIALKLTKPDVFENKVKKYLFKLFDDSALEAPPELKEKRDKIWLDILESSEEVKPYLEKVREKFRDDDQNIFKNEAKEPFATISHVDLWTNNTMQVFKDGKPIKNKILDFQTLHYFSATKDLIFFLFSSVQITTLQEHFDNLIKFYHENFISILDKCGCDIKPFRYEKFLEEIDENAPLEFFHALFMQFWIYSKKGEAAMENIEENNEEMDKMAGKFTELAKKRTVFVVSSFGKRGWL